MKVAVIGAGAMGRAVLQDLVAARELERILILDAEAERAREVAAALGDPRAQAGSVDATAVDQTAAALRGIDVVVNAAQYTVNVPVMRACVRARCHYADLGGMFHTTRKQLELSGDFERAGLTAVVGIGAGPGITNMVACYAADRLDQVESLRTSFAAVDLTDLRGIDVFAPPYSIRTIMEEFTEDTVQFLGGEYRVLPALAGAEDIEFPEPIGKRRCVHTLHSEPATLPAAFAHKGVREVTWKLGMRRHACSHRSGWPTPSRSRSVA
jgi:saccharopine dehydrogenase (NAD+, L-lysine-forming)